MGNQRYQPTLTHLKAFISIARHRHFGLAAQALGMSQPSLSQALAALEQGIGATLIERSTRRVLVTPEGEQLLSLAESTIDAAEGFLHAASGLGAGLVGRLRIGFIPTCAPYLLPTLLSVAHQDYPELIPVVVEDHTARLLDMLRTGTLDVALLAAPIEEKTMAVDHLYHEDFVAVVPATDELAGSTDVQVDDLVSRDLLLLDEGHCLRDQVLDLCRAIPHSPSDRDFRAATLATVVCCVAGGLGMTLVPASAVAVETREPGLATAEFREPRPGRDIVLVYRSSSPRASDFGDLVDLIRRAWAQIVATDAAA